MLGTRRRSFGGVVESFLALPSLFVTAAGMRHRLDAMTLSYRLTNLLTVTSMSLVWHFVEARQDQVDLDLCVRQQMTENAEGTGLRKKNAIFDPVGEGDELN